VSASSLGQHPDGFFLVERHRPLQLRRPDARVDLRGVDTGVAEQSTNLLKIMVLLKNLHRHAVPQVVRLEFGAADQPAVHLAEAPDVLAGHRRLRLADAAATPGRPKQRRVRIGLVDLFQQHPLDVCLQECHNCRRQRDVTRLAALDPDASQAPGPIKMVKAQGGHGLAAHTRVTKDQEDGHVTGPPALLRGRDERVHDRRSGDLPGRFPVMRRPLELRASRSDDRQSPRLTGWS